MKKTHHRHNRTVRADRTDRRRKHSAGAVELLRCKEWAGLLGMSPRGFRDRAIVPAERRSLKGGLTAFYRFSDLPENYRERLKELKKQSGYRFFRDLLPQAKEPSSCATKDFAAVTLSGYALDLLRIEAYTKGGRFPLIRLDISAGSQERKLKASPPRKRNPEERGNAG